MTIRNLRIALLATVATALGATTASANLVSDGDFESGAFGPWVSGGGGFTSISATNPNNGTYSYRSGCTAAACVVVDAAGVSGTGSIIQTVNLSPGVYRLAYSQSNDSSTAPNQFAVGLGTNVLRNVTDSTSHGYLDYEHFSAVSGGLTNVSFAIRHSPSFMNVDDVDLIMIDDGEGNDIAAASQSNAIQDTYGFLDRLQNRFGHAGSPVQVALNAPVDVASSTGGYISANGRYRAYMSGYGDRSQWDSGDVRSRRWGLTAGAEMAVTDNLDLGLAVAAGHSRFASDTLLTDNRGRADEYSGAVYGHFGPSSIPLYVTAAAGYGYASNDLSRSSLLGFGTAIARGVESTQWFGSVELGYDWSLSNTFILTPYARADGTRLNQDGYAETVLLGDPLMPMTVEAVDQDAARTILGARGTFDLNVGRRGAKLTASAGWAHEFERDRLVAFSTTSTSLTGGTDVTFAGITGAASPDANSVVAGASVEAPVSNQARIFVGYNGNFASGQDSHAGEVGIRVVW
ncbi:MAG: autotransporter domain-containing protein [Micropepsaceae bacterium]